MSDPQEDVVPDVKVTVTNVSTNVSETSTTNSTGFYRVQNLVPGVYRVQFMMCGFAPLEIGNVHVLAARVFTEDAELKLGALQQMVQAPAAPSLIRDERFQLLNHSGREYDAEHSTPGSRFAATGI